MPDSRPPLYFNTAACGLIDPAVKAAADNFYNALCTGGSRVAEQWRGESEPRIRDVVARFIGAPAANVALVPNFSWAMNGLVQSLRGDEKVLLYRGDYPSLTLPFAHNGFDIHWVDSPDDFELPIEEILSLVSRKCVDLLAISHVQYNSGYTIDLEKIAAACREAGVYLIVDATQSLGALPVNVQAAGIDVLIASHYKWMNAGFGTGMLYMSDAFAQVYPPVIAGNNSIAGKGGQEGTLPVRYYEPGHPNMYGLSLLEAAIRRREEEDVAAIAAHNAMLTKLFLDNMPDSKLRLLGSPDMRNRCSILVFRDVWGLSGHLASEGIVCTIRGGLVRLSFHIHNRASEVQELLTAFYRFQPAVEEAAG